jgi:aldehyde:ferredoxin oxidoreductase
MSYGGWTGKILRVDLSTGAITTVDTINYKDYLGGTGFGWKVLWDEVPAGTKALSKENKIIFGVGPISGSGAPSSGRMVITSLMPINKDLPGAGHGGGAWGPELKYAGWDSIIVQGQAANPVWIKIVDDQVTIEDASALWGSGTYHTTAEICTIMGSDAQVACIGQAGEKLVSLSCVINSRHHSAGGGGLGAVMGYKNLKAIGVRGTGAVKIAADAATWKALNYKWLSLMGANNNHVVPMTTQPWAEFSDSGSRWTANKGLYWGAASPPVETGYCTDFEHPLPKDCPVPQNKMGRRTHKGFKDYGMSGANHTVKMNGCLHCPIRCHISTDVPQLEQYGVSRYNENTCTGNSILSSIMTDPRTTDSTLILSQMSTNLTSDYGFWHDYSQWSNCFNWARTHVMTTLECSALGLPATNINGLPFVGRTPFQNRLPAAELTILTGNSTGSTPYTTGTPFAKSVAGDPSGEQDLIKLILGLNYITSNNPTTTPVFSDAVANGPDHWATIWPEIGYFNNHSNASSCFKMNHAKHHGVESFGQVGCLINMTYNRDPMNHTHQNVTVGPPPATINTLMKELFSSPTAPSMFNDPAGSDICFLPATNYHPVTNGMAAFAAACMVELELKNAMITCDWMMPLWLSPLKSKGYRGDIAFHADLYSAVTGDTVDTKGLQKIGLRLLTLFRALTARQMDWAIKQVDASKKVNMRTDHDYMNDWMFDKVGDLTTGPAHGPGTGIPNSASGNTAAYATTAVPFTGGTQLMDRADMETARNLLYAQLGWDTATGMPTSATLSSLGLGYIQTALPALIVG